ncbi:RloB family protein [Limosilactobacillus reuteri]|uniref:RloB family protein n=1 Tax=Limosilactobacillus reuteri TaxID=1598 RepID=UPI001E36FB65|nr:RloB family protein [Limosilactobacillus reuteri]MCC4324901.1 RloB family protein [Limosilactobacillus reuteri]MCC4330421.1 RloB family protein [Limosilactobacillus reuteri]
MGRKSRGIEPRQTIGIYCEGESECQYFNMLRQKYNAKNVRSQKLDIKSLNKSGKNLIIAANQHKKANKQSKAYVVFDRDIDNINKSIDEIRECQRLAERYNITILFSSINFEIWILMHYEPVMRSYTRRELYRKLSGEKYFNTDYEKFKGDSYRPYLFDKVIKAKANAEKLYKVNPKMEKDDPYTNIHRYLGEIFKVSVF